MFHITNALVRPGRKVTFLIILAYIFLSLLALSTPIALLHSGIQKFVDGIAWNILYFIFLVPFLLSSIFMVANSIRKAESQDEKSRLLYILTAFIIAVFTGITDLVQALKVPIPPLGHLGCVIYSSILAIGILKHQAAYDIFAQMQTKLEFLAEMAAGIAHEIRNPLTSIKGASNLLAKELENIDLPDTREYHNIIAEEIERLNHILIDFQYFTRPLKIEKESVSINEIIRKTVRLAEIGPMRIKTKQEYDENSPKVEADASLLKQVFLNLIKNAEEACGLEGELVIKTEHVPSWVKISFSDNGPGIPPENLKSIFNPFFSTKPAGIGMGL
jgi:signal transduction histidine kinase